MAESSQHGEGPHRGPLSGFAFRLSEYLRDRSAARCTPALIAAPDSAAPLRVPFVAYTEDCRIFGSMSLERDRLSDVLNAQDQFVLDDVLVESLADGRQARTDHVTVSRAELVAVHADGGPRGDAARRIRTISYPVAVKTGDFEVRGYLHTRPGTEPLASARYRKPMIPLTDATIAYRAGAAPAYASAGTIVVNREAAEWIRPIPEHEVRFWDRETARARRQRPGVGSEETA